jgi:excinuclease ABC subunit C
MSPLPLLQQPDRLRARLKEVPSEPGCYLMRDGDDRILYIGKAKVLRNRVRSYFQSGGGHAHSPRIALMVRQVCEIEFIVTDSEAEALALEANLIKNHQPHFNVLLKDDKKYPSLCITWSEPYPRIFITRRRRFRSPLDRFYGPYVDVGLLRQTLPLGRHQFYVCGPPAMMATNMSKNTAHSGAGWLSGARSAFSRFTAV